MPADVMEEELLRSIDEIDLQIKSFRKKVQAVLDAAQDGNMKGGGSGSEESA